MGGGQVSRRRAALVAACLTAGLLAAPVRSDASPAAPPVISPESAVTDPTIGQAYESAEYDQIEPAVVRDFVVWADSRSGDDSYDIYGARVDAGTGVILDPGGLRIATGPGNQRAPAVAWNGTHFLVVWEDDRGESSDIYAIRVDSAGVPTGEEITIAAAPDDETAPAIASDGNGFLVAWEFDGDGLMRSRQLAADGTPIAVETIPANTLGTQDDLSVTWGPASGEYLLVWRETIGGSSDAIGKFIASDGTDIGGTAFGAAPGDQRAPAAAATDSGFLVVWQDERSGDPDVYAGRINLSNVLQDGGGFLVAGGTAVQRSPTVASAGSSSFVVWREGPDDGTDIKGSRIVNALVSAPIVLADQYWPEGDPIITGAAQNYLAVWGEPGANSDLDVSGTRVSHAGQPLTAGGFVVSSQAPQQETPAVAWNGSEYLAVWLEDRGNNPYVYATRISAAGDVVDPEGFQVTDVRASAIDPAVASDGSSFLVTWSDARNDELFDLYAARVTSAGEVLDPEGFMVAEGAGSHVSRDIVWTGSAYVVVWERRLADNSEVMSTLVNTDGSVSSTTVQVSIDPAHHDSLPRVAMGSDRLLVVWERDGTDTFGRLLRTDGEIDDDLPLIELSAISNEIRPDVAWNGSTFLVVWSGDGERSVDIFGAHMGETGTPSNRFTISSASDVQSDPTVAARGGEFLVSWTDMRSGNPDVYAGRVPPTGGVAETSAVATSPDAESARAMATGSPGRTLIAYQRLATEPTLGAPRVFWRFYDIFDTEITAGPDGYSNSFATTFAFGSLPGSTFRCRFDTDAFGPCTSPVSRTLDNEFASHSFEVYAVDAAGAADPTPARREWIVDTSPPIVEITSPQRALYVAGLEVQQLGTQAITLVTPEPVRVRATDAQSPLADVCLFVDDAPAGCLQAPNTADDQYQFDPAYGLGNNRIVVRGRNAAGGVRSADITVFAVAPPLPL